MGRVDKVTRCSQKYIKERCAVEILLYLNRRKLADDVIVYVNNMVVWLKNGNLYSRYNVKASECISGADDDLLTISFDGSEFLRQYRYGNGGYRRPKLLKDLNIFLARRGLKLEVIDWMGYIREI